ncbi:MAG: NAD(P)-dependent oxidoreductase [Bacteroidetes bacterium]|nr:NAD(P)-dependent oxidoreductase [Bacteroidota bacterium]MDA1121267.1 NAD(P)-dependent oxidoreductase [Bacteroidota bacterium]
MNTVEKLEDFLSTPSDELVADLSKIEGDILILGLGGKMGPTLALLAQRAVDEGNLDKRVIGVSRFSDKDLRSDLESAGIKTIAGDLLDTKWLSTLSDIENVIYMAGNKFGTTGNEHYTWAMNTFVPGMVASKYRNSRIVVFSTGNVYPLSSVTEGGATELSRLGPIGEYAQSCLGRERMFEYFSNRHQTPVVLFRLNYALEMRYGVLLEIGQSVFKKKPVDLKMGHVNLIWQGDANEFALRSLLHCSSPPNPINVTGHETLSIKWIAEEFGKLFGIKPAFESAPEETALLSNTTKANGLFGTPKVPIGKMIEWTANWISIGGETLDKPTHFQEREGAF